MKDTISHYFEALEDPRAMRNQRHPLVTLIGTSLLACLSGIDSFSGMQDFVDMHFESLCAHFDFPNGIMTVLRKWAMAILAKAKTKPKQSIKSVMRRNAMSFKHFMTSANKILHAYGGREECLETYDVFLKSLLQEPSIHGTQS